VLDPFAATAVRVVVASARAASTTRSAVAGEIPMSRPLRTKETVVLETPARFATSAIVTRDPRCLDLPMLAPLASSRVAHLDYFLTRFTAMSILPFNL